MTVTLGCYLAEWLFPEFKYKWLAKEFQINLPHEIDFNNEGKNADRIRELFKDDPRVVVKSKMKNKYRFQKYIGNTVLQLFWL